MRTLNHGAPPRVAVLALAAALAASGCIDIDRSPPITADIGIDAIGVDGTSGDASEDTSTACTLDEDCIGVLTPTPCTRVDCQSGQCALAPDMARVGLECTSPASLCITGTCADTGDCIDLTTRDCSQLDNDVCATGVCNEATGDCEAQYATQGTSCTAPLCYGASCDGSGACIDEGITAGAACSTGVECLEEGICSDTGVCEETWACTCESDDECDDGLQCTEDVCTEGACTFTPYDSTCAINNTCYFTGTESAGNACFICEPALSQSGWTEVACDDGNPCTEDSCDPTSGCVNTPVADATPCTGTQSCGSAGAVCLGGLCSCDIQCTLTSDCATNPAAPELNACQKYKCDEGACTVIADEALEGAACDDGDACTQEGVCTAGACDAPPVDCLGGPCSLATCEPNDSGSYDCIFENLAEASPCDDGDPCTEADACDADGSCIGATLDCSAFDGPCTVGACTDGACDQSPVANGTGCDDGSVCTDQDACLDGVCTGTGACTCQVSGECDDGLTCTTPFCNGGTCEFPANAGQCVIEGACYADSETHPQNPCLICDPARSQVGWSSVICDDGNSCTDDSCDPVSGGCLNVPNDANSCNDGDDCTADDACVAGQCVGTCECTEDADCDVEPAPACQRWTCSSFTCVAVTDPALNGSSCDDGAFCTSGDVCSAGVCSGATETDCSTAGDGMCKVGVCDEDADACVAINADAGTACDDGDPCLEGDACDALGACVGTPKDCSYLDTACVAGGCNAGSCTPQYLQGQGCDDGEGCTEEDICDDAGSCAGTWNSGLAGCGCGSDSDCTGLDDTCNTGRCNLDLNECYKEPKGGNPVCDDGDPCTQGDACTSTGSCAGSPYACDDGLACTNDTCDGDGDCTFDLLNGFCVIDGTCRSEGQADPDNGCQACLTATSTSNWSPNNGVACDDGDDCTSADACQGGSCGGTPYTCQDDGLACTDEVCTPVDGECESVIVAGNCLIGGICYTADAANPSNPCQRCKPGTSPDSWTNVGGNCDDGDPCTSGDSCSGGACAGSPYVCNDNKGCTTDTCDGSGGCSFDVVAGACLINGTCRTNGEDNPTNECQECDPAQSQSVWSGVATGTICDDGLPCTSPDTCDGLGACVGGSTNCNPDWCEDASCGATGCDLTLKPNHCKIGGVCYLEGAVNPSNSCQACVSAVSGTTWTNTSGTCDDGQPCTFGDTCNGGSCVGTFYFCEDGQDCTLDSCDGQGGCNQQLVENECFIGGFCYQQGEPNPGNDCRLCSPSVSQTSWTDATQGTSCFSGSGLSCTIDTCQSGICTSDYNPGSGECFIGGTCVGNGEPNGNNPCEACDVGKSTQSWTVAPDGTSCGSGDGCGGDFCQSGICSFVTLDDFSACDDFDASTTGDWCYQGVCDGFNNDSVDTHSVDGYPDRYERARRTSDGQEAYATWTTPGPLCGMTRQVPDGDGDKSCPGDASISHFSYDIIEDWSMMLYAGTTVPLRRHGLTEDYAGIDEKPLELFFGTWADWSGYTGSHITEVGYGWYDIADDGSVYETWLFVDNKTIWACIDDGGIACAPDDNNLSLGKTAGFVALGGEPFLIDSTSGKVRAIAPNEEKWSVAHNTNLNGSGPARDTIAANDYAVVVGHNGMLFALDPSAGNNAFVSIAVPGLSNQSQVDFEGVTTFAGRFFAVGNRLSTSNGVFYTKDLVVVHGPTDSGVMTASNWSGRVVYSQGSGCPLGQCWLADIEARGIAGLDEGDVLYIFGGNRAAASSDQERGVWLFAPFN